MSRAASNVVVKFVLQGVDKVSAVMNGVAASTDKVTRSVQKAGDASQRAGNLVRSAFSGDVVSSVQAMSGALGGTGGLATAAAAATAGTVALGAAAVSAAYKFTQWSVEVERTRAALDSTFGQGQGVDAAIGFAREIGGVGVESVAKLATTLRAAGLSANITAEQMRELTARATTMGASGDEALTAFARAIQTGNTRALQQVGTFINAGRVLDEYAKSVGKSTTELTQYERQAAVLDAVQKDLGQRIGSTSDLFARQDDALARLDVAWSDFKSRLSETAGGPAVEILEVFGDFLEIVARMGQAVAALGVAIGTTFTANTRAAGIAIGGLAAAVATLAKGGSLATAANLLERASDDAVASGIGKTADAWRKVYDAIATGTAKVRAVESISTSGGLKAYLQQVDLVIKATSKVIKNADKEIEKARIRRAARAARTRKKGITQDQAFAAVAANAGELIFDAQAPARAAAAQAQASRELLQARIEAATNPVRKVELELQAIEIDNAAKIAEITAKVTDARARDLALQAQAIAVETKRTQALSKFAQATDAQAQSEKSRQMATVEGWVAIGSATAQGIAAMVESERKRAAIMAVVSAADAAVQFYRGNIPGAIAAGFAAAKYGAVALGAGAAGSAAGAGRFGAGGTAAERQAAPTATTDSGPRVVNITLGGGFVIGTPQMVGKSVANAMKSLDGTGYEAAA